MAGAQAPAENNDLFLRQFGGAAKTTEKSAPSGTTLFYNKFPVLSRKNFRHFPTTMRFAAGGHTGDF